MKIGKIILLGSMFVLALAAWTSVCAAEEVVIGYSGPLSGPAAEYGQDSINGIDMAIREINAAGGLSVKGETFTLKLRRLDDRAGMDQAIINARKFVNQDKAPVVF
nr:ABC transporter substrate-binding protein [Syntrophaceae bacterium]